MSDIEKILWYDTMVELIELGFDLHKNSARDLILSVQELIKINKERGNDED